jgi:methylmalonyl-CoA mutase, N-terminal domain
MNKPIDENAAAGRRQMPKRTGSKEYAEQIGTDRQVANRSGIEIKPLYTQRDWDATPARRTSAFPASRPTRAASTPPCTAAAPGPSAS